MTDLPKETRLAKVRLHWGVFIPVLLAVLCPILPALPIILLMHGLMNAFGHAGMGLNQTPVVPGLNLMWMSVLVPYFVIGVGLFLTTWFSYSKSEVTLTDRRLVFRTGFLSRRSGELPLENVESIYISEPLLGRLCGYGTVTVTTVGGARFPLSFIASPVGFHAALQEAVSNAKGAGSRMAKRTESGSARRDDDSQLSPVTSKPAS